MKPAKSSLIVTLSLLLWFSFTTTKPSSLALAAEPVLDFNGDQLVAGQKYFIGPGAMIAGAGTVRRERTSDSSCSYSIILSGTFNFKADPVKFSIPGTSTGIIYEGSTEVEIEFENKPECSESSKWVAAAESGSSSLSSAKLVMGGPAEHYPNSHLVSGVFRIEKFEEFYFPKNYKLVFCPKFNHHTSGSCYNVVLGERMQLSLDGFPFTFVFMKARDQEADGTKYYI